MFFERSIDNQVEKTIEQKIQDVLDPRDLLTWNTYRLLVDCSHLGGS
jgi:hypothetical protein